MAITTSIRLQLFKRIFRLEIKRKFQSKCRLKEFQLITQMKLKVSPQQVFIIRRS